MYLCEIRDEESTRPVWLTSTQVEQNESRNLIHEFWENQEKLKLPDPDDVNVTEDNNLPNCNSFPNYLLNITPVQSMLTDKNYSEINFFLKKKNCKENYKKELFTDEQVEEDFLIRRNSQSLEILKICNIYSNEEVAEILKVGTVTGYRHRDKIYVVK